MEEQSKKNLYQRIAAVMADVEYLQKDDKVGTGNYAYKAISIEKVVEAVRQSLIKHGLVILPIKQTHVMEDKVRTNNNGQQIIVPITTVDVEYRIVNIDDPEDDIVVVSSGTGVDPQDKGVGKAMTYSYKNMILRTFAIPTGDDTDKAHNKDLEAQQKPAKQSAPKADQKAPVQAESKPMQAEQREQILELLKHPAQTEATVKKVTSNLDKCDYDQALKTILYLKKQIAEAAQAKAESK